ncbi:MAG: hypothetical protein KIT83_17360 [Bryobacterales bacterium]|nr:hypothetical protein [Bryobacterales bacterium]
MYSTNESIVEERTDCLENLELMLTGLCADLHQPGIAGQRLLHARLQDLQATLLRMQGSRGWQAEQRQRALVLLAECRRHLQQTNGVLTHLRQWVEHRHALGGAEQGYGDAVGRGRPGGLRTESSRGGAMESTIA